MALLEQVGLGFSRKAEEDLALTVDHDHHRLLATISIQS
jgi:hypothetical protein